jgi:uncharacterized protein with NAD-binding domain and iron-sulfur cluster
LANLFVAGDWTATGWPATMEGAVRSGYLAAEELLQRACAEERRMRAKNRWEPTGSISRLSNTGWRHNG